MDIGEDSVRISQLPRTDQILSGDMFMFSMEAGTNPVISSHSSTANDIVHDVMNRFLSDISVGSMAYQNKYDYAKANHDHDYTKVLVRTYQTGGTKIGCVKIQGDGYQICSDVLKHDYEFPKEPIPPVGSVRTFYSPTKTLDSILLDIQNGTFDGWTYPDGRSYSKHQGEYDFTDAYQHFSGTGNTFSVPSLSSFFRLITGEYAPCGHFQQQVGIMDHQHMAQNMKVDCDFSESVGVHQYLTDKGGTLSSNAIHGSDGKKNQKDTNNSISVSNYDVTMYLRERVKIGNESVGETYPSHNVVPCMIYIGKTKTGVLQ